MILLNGIFQYLSAWQAMTKAVFCNSAGEYPAVCLPEAVSPMSVTGPGMKGERYGNS
jgi:hypothetical protein